MCTDMIFARENRFPERPTFSDVRTQLAVPLISRGSAIGNIMICRTDVVKPFTDKSD